MSESNPSSETSLSAANARLAGWWSRFFAVLVDSLVVFGFAIVIAIPIIPIALLGESVLTIIVATLGGIVFFVGSLLYAPLLMARKGRRNGQTLGKQALGIRVVKDTGEPFGVGDAAIRELLIKMVLFGWIGGMLASAPTLADYLWPIWDEENRTLHDMLASTHVVLDPIGTNISG